MIGRQQLPRIREVLAHGKAIVLIGPRQVGKTTLIRQLVADIDRPVLWLTGDDPGARALLHDITLARLQAVLDGYDVVVIDEAQRLHNAGLTLKLITDHFPQVQLLVTGSSSLDLAAQTRESLVGRKREFQLYPLSFSEISTHQGFALTLAQLEERLVFGAYPEVFTQGPTQARRILNELGDGLMYKDLLALDSLKKPSLLTKLLQALALQVGSEVSYHELAQLVGADTATVERYIGLLEETYILFRLPSLSRNARNEIKKGRKVYFYDNGIRNAVIQNFTPVALRQDVGALWENFLVSERVKRNAYKDFFCNTYFWRNTNQQEIDYVEEHSGQLFAYEFKWRPEAKARIPKAFLDAYPSSRATVVGRDNFEDFVL